MNANRNPPPASVRPAAPSYSPGWEADSPTGALLAHERAFQQEVSVRLAADTAEPFVPGAAHLALVDLALVRGERLLQALSRITMDVLQGDEMGACVRAALRHLAEAGGFHRGGLLQNLDATGAPGRGWWRVTHEWVASPHALQGETEHASGSWEGFEDLEERLFEGRIVDGVRDAVPPVIRALMESVGAHYTINAPIFIGEQFWGVLAFDDCEHPRRRTNEERSAILAAAQVFGLGLYRHEMREQRDRLERALGGGGQSESRNGGPVGRSSWSAADLGNMVDRLVARTHEDAVVEERKRLARELHDHLAQGFTGVIIQLEAAARALLSGDEGAATQHIARAAGSARESLAETRSAVRALRVSPLRGRGLAEALRTLLDGVFLHTPVEGRCLIEGRVPDLPPEWEHHLLRIVQEATTNVLRHAGATVFACEITSAEGRLVIVLRDDGRGFDLETPGPGLGLAGIRERAALMGGSCGITSRPGHGTRIAVTIPSALAAP